VWGKIAARAKKFGIEAPADAATAARTVSERIAAEAKAAKAAQPLTREEITDFENRFRLSILGTEVRGGPGSGPQGDSAAKTAGKASSKEEHKAAADHHEKEAGKSEKNSPKWTGHMTAADAHNKAAASGEEKDGVNANRLSKNLA
jgi:hypothetical protein